MSKTMENVKTVNSVVRTGLMVTIWGCWDTPAGIPIPSILSQANALNRR